MEDLKNLEKKIEELQKMVKSQDLLIKGQVNRFNEIAVNLQTLIKKLDTVGLTQKIPEVPPQKPDVVNTIPEELIIKESDKPLQPGRHQKVEPYDDSEFQDHSDSSENVVIDLNFKAEVSQRVLDSNNKSVYMAAVEFKDKKTKELVLRVTTKPHGKYNATIPIGIYEVVISKQASLSRPRLEKTVELNIDGTNKKIELPDIVL